jgi:hypothetical protein
MVAAVGVVVLLAWAVSAEGAFTLLFGWVPFLWNVVPQTAPDWPSVGVGVAAFGLFAVGLHLFARARRPGWKARWTLSAVVGCVVLFAAGTAVVGVTHQIGWLASSGKPLRSETLRDRDTQEINAHILGVAATNYTDMSQGRLPPGGTFTPNGDMLHSWETELLVGLNYSTRSIDRQKVWNDPVNVDKFKCVIPELINPGFRTPQLTDADGYGLSHYAMNERVARPNRGMKTADIRDGAANTILFGEVNSGFRPWGHPVNWRDPAVGLNRPGGFGGPPGAGGVYFVMADGSVRFVSSRVSANTLRALSTPNAGDGE